MFVVWKREILFKTSHIKNEKRATLYCECQNELNVFGVECDFVKKIDVYSLIKKFASSNIRNWNVDFHVTWTENITLPYL